MESMELVGFYKVLADFGILGLVIFLWWLDSKKVYRILDQYKNDMDEQRLMYEKNVSLVKGYQGLATDLKDVVILNTQAMTKIAERMKL